jgi:hypothetical protein
MRWFFVLMLAACEPPQPGVDVVVTAASSGALIKDAVVAVACPEAMAGAAAFTDSTGHARVTVFADAASPCSVTVSHPRFDPAQLHDVEICPPEIACEPLAIALDEVSP